MEEWMLMIVFSLVLGALSWIMAKSKRKVSFILLVLQVLIYCIYLCTLTIMIQ